MYYDVKSCTITRSLYHKLEAKRCTSELFLRLKIVKLPNQASGCPAGLREELAELAAAQSKDDHQSCHQVIS